MAAELQIVSTLDNDDTINGFVETEEAAKKTSTAIEGAAKSTESMQQKLRQLRKEQDNLTLDERIKAVKDVFDNAAPSVDKLTAEIKEYQSLALAAGRETPVGREFLEKAAQAKDRLVDLQNETKRLSDDNRNLKAAIQGIGVGVSAFAGVTAAAAAFGGENEELRQALVKVTAAQTLLNSVQQIQVALQKESSLRLAITNGAMKAQGVATAALAAIQQAYAIVVGGTTGALKAFRIALISTGIGAIVVGVGLLIANFESLVSWVGNAIESFRNMSGVIRILLLPFTFLLEIGLLIFDMFSEQQEIESELAIQRRQQANELARQTQERIDGINAIRDAEKAAFESRQTAFDLEIARIEAEGGASFALKKQKLQDIIDEEKAILESNLNKTQLWIDYYTNLAALNGQSTDEFKAQLKAQGTDLDALLTEVEEAQQQQRDKIFAAETNLIALETANNEKRRSDAKKTADAKIKEAEREASRREEILRQLQDLEIAAIEDEQTRRAAELQVAFERRIATLNTQKAEEAELLKALEEQLLTDLLELRNEFSDKEEQRIFDESQRLADLRAQLLEGRKLAEAEQRLLDEEAENIRFEAELERIRFQEQQKAITKEEARLQQELAEQEHQNNLTEINKKGEEDRTKKNLAAANDKIAIVQHFAQSVGQINDLINQIQDNRRKKDTEASLKEQKKRFNREKAFNIVMALINGAAASVQAIAQFGPPPSPLGIAGLAAATTVTALSVAAIASKKFNPSGGGAGAGGGGATAGFSPSTGGGGGSAAPNIPITTVGGGGDTGGDTGGGGGGDTGQPTQTVIKAFVVGNEMTTAQEAETLIEELATN